MENKEEFDEIKENNLTQAYNEVGGFLLNIRRKRMAAGAKREPDS